MPLPFLRVSHEADDFAVHCTFPETFSSLSAAPDLAKVREAAPSFRIGFGPFWCTVKDRAMPPPSTVIDPDRVPGSMGSGA